MGAATRLGRRSHSRLHHRLRLHRLRRFIIAVTPDQFTVKRHGPELTKAVGHLREAVKHTAEALNAYSQALDALKETVADTDEDTGTCPIHGFTDCVCSGPPDFVIAYAGNDTPTPPVNNCPTLDAPAGHVDHECCCDGCCPTDGSGGDGG